MTPETAPEARVALVTGGNRGIGRETARQLTRLGVTVLIGSRDATLGREAADELAAEGGTAIPVLVDVSDTSTLDALTDQIRTRWGRLDALVNNAGTFVGATAADTSVDDMQQTFAVNVFGVVASIHALLPLLRASAAPRIVNVSSTTASLALTAAGANIPGDPTRRLAYTSSKAALNMLTVQYAKAFAADPALAHIKINSITPGYTATDMNSYQGTRSVVDAAQIIVRFANLPENGPSGGFFDDDGPIPW